jgi:hypothetical protein
LKGHACFHLAIQPPRLVCVCGRRHHAVFSPFKYRDRKFLEEPSGATDEKQRQTITPDERTISERQEVQCTRTELERHLTQHFPFVFSIKLYAWEHAFLRRILFVRNEEELKLLKKIGIRTVR